MDGGFANFGIAPGADEVLNVQISCAPRAAIGARPRSESAAMPTAALAATSSATTFALWMRRAVAVAVFTLFFGVRATYAQFAPPPPPPPPPPPSVSITSNAIGSSADYTLFGLSSRYLQYLSNMGGPSAYRSMFGTGANPNGGGAPAPIEAPRWRAWTELYGLGAKTGAQNIFPGDSRRTYGGIAGIALSVTPDAMVGLSVDQSRTGIDIVGLPQHASLDLTQVGINGAYQWGAWTFSAAGVAGVAGIDSNRDTPSGPATASYGANVWGVVGEADYLIPLGSMRVVPKLGADWTQTRVDAYTEAGGLDAVSVPSAQADRGRIFAGVEIGNTSVTNTTVFDVSGYAKAVDILVQHVPTLTVSAVSGPATPVTVFGVTESKYGVDAGATASLRLSATTRLYAIYDGKFRDGFTSHGGSLGLEFRW